MKEPPIQKQSPGRCSAYATYHVTMRAIRAMPTFTPSELWKETKRQFDGLLHLKVNEEDGAPTGLMVHVAKQLESRVRFDEKIYSEITDEIWNDLVNNDVELLIATGKPDKKGHAFIFSRGRIGKFLFWKRREVYVEDSWTGKSQWKALWRFRFTQMWLASRA